MTHKIRVVLADDDEGIRKDLAELLENQESLDLVAAVSDGTWALRVIEDSAIDVALLDVAMPFLDGISTAREITSRYPHVKVIMLTAFEQSDSLRKSLAAGAQAFLTKDMPIARLVDIIHRVAAGESIMDSQPTAMLIQSYLHNEHPIDTELLASIYALPPRLTTILNLLIRGKTTADIGENLTLSERSVRTYVSQLLQATGCKNRGELVVRAMRSGYQPART